MIANSRNRVTSIKPSRVCWLKTASWDFLTPARRQLMEISNMTSKRTLDERFFFGTTYRKFKSYFFRDKEDDEILARFKRRKMNL